MVEKPLNVLKKGLNKLKEQVETRKNDLLARLKRQETISPDDEDWLDQEGNLVDEEALVDMLENASNYERGLARLDSRQQPLVKKLMELGTEIKKVVSKKRKRPDEPRKVPAKDKKEKVPVFTKKENATLGQRIEILDWHHAQRASQKATAEYFDKKYPNLKLKQPIISSWIKNESYWQEQHAETQAKGRPAGVKKAKQTVLPSIDEMETMESWY